MQRIAALDGLRGIAAFVVVVFHYLCFLYPSFIPDFSTDPVEIADTPLGILWNGPFAVSIFFVLSGFVLAGAADRRRNLIVSSLVTRYLRLAVPVLASVLLAWTLLKIWPTATASMQAALEDPSPWLNHTLQGDIPSIYAAFYDGLVGNFRWGGSPFNNVLWTMRIELLGSVGIFIIYWLTYGRVRLTALALAGVLLILAPSLEFVPYLAFVLGALIYEAHVRGAFRNPSIQAGLLALFVGILLGAPGRGFAERWEFPVISGRLAVGEPQGIVPVVAAALILFAVLSLRPVAMVLTTAIPQWLGRVSFSLYLVHVPILYTLIAAAYLQIDWPPALLALCYMALALGLAHVFTLAVDEPCLRILKRVRTHLQPWEVPSVLARLRRRPLSRRGASSNR